MFWILAILIIFMFYRPKEMMLILFTFAFFGIGYWIFSFISSEPVLTFSITVFVIWILSLFLGLINKTIEEDKNEDDT
ncbi:hypothetical protein AM2_014 [Lactococcus phage AM2]|uniref:Uncharacterized protein n=7 Tax=Audreyjarvisvirus AM1 TaxID=2845188 RepID=A0A1W6JLE8_9CAUD|nr:hypothetical protein H1Z30_gp014 [Lactococcus phage AM1]ARM66319.1 hypothetical protein AM2_014 [Lactococcus phage AM2]ARM66496.1 hypothetical protein AM3_014 [Lactococcus phage AM3]ARM67049.1 hypothetical protein AM8_014 [Lactococcus phage AM8]ARM67227.1 hypothetical protein AM9_014 [Lactococcus phage AM9]ARM67406.1 hypothetical protein AM11_014 [Lactococcus phage AM11]ARQ95594.1 hypothetical protein AM12_015 [Lactococcus phage AM12]